MANRKAIYAVIGIIIIIIIIVGVYYAATLGSNPSQTGSPNVTLQMYEGEITVSGQLHGAFGNSQNGLTSPGPTLTFKVGDVVKVTVNNVGTLPHNWAIVTDKATPSSVVFNAQIQSGSNPILPGSSGSVTFKVDKAGSYSYICQVPGHVDLGMYGSVTVNP